ncbi:MAG: Nif11-like leader peptide family natural product precursor [Rhizonema sp. PD38]|nr:Nif11-like leader peptide family natural product precursor [Rhizonema sp. PD38]
MSLENVKAFYERLTSDQAFRAQIQGSKSQDEYCKIVKGAGYVFNQEELEEYTAELLESTNAEESLRDLNEKELAAVFGGTFLELSPIQTVYGVTQAPFDPPIYSA